VTEYTEKTEFVVDFTKTVNEEEVTQQVVVVHDKKDQTNEIIGVEEVKETIVTVTEQSAPTIVK
jgi:hypothetical protein